MHVNERPALESGNHWTWVQNLPTGGLRDSSFHNWPSLLTTLQADTRRGLRGETDFTQFRERRICEEKLFILSVRSPETHSHSLRCPRDRRAGTALQSWTRLLSALGRDGTTGPMGLRRCPNIPTPLASVGRRPRGWMRFLITVFPEGQETHLL